MSDKRQETIADIVAEMRIGDICAADTSASRPEYINDFLASYADRIEVAWKREVETTTDESSAVGNAATVREVAQEMLNTSMQSITAERINGWASRLAAACEQPVTDCNQLGNTAKMREALERLRERALMDLYENAFVADPSGNYKEFIKRTIKIAESVLSAPPRNCDRFATLDDARNTFFADYVPDETRSSATAFAIWLFDKAKGEADEQK